jgi:hypothetical protein
LIWTSGNDGPGSGLDADLLDGQHGSYYVNTSGNQTIDGTKTFTSTIVGNISGNAERATGLFLYEKPTTTSSLGTKGMFAYGTENTAQFLYICVAPNTWRRVQISAF